MLYVTNVEKHVVVIRKPSLSSVVTIWHILSNLKPYILKGFLEPCAVNESKILTVSQALNLLKQQGYAIKYDVVTAH